MEDEFDKVLERWSVRAEDLELGEVIGAGSFGVVRAGTLKEGTHKLKVAVKQLPISDTAPAKEWHRLLQEAVVLAKASERCKSTCRLYGICCIPGNFCLVMKQYVTSLDRKLNDYPDRKAPQRKVEQWMLEICQALVELHAQNVILRDLKPANVLLDEFEGAILADFGVSRIVKSTIAQLQSTTIAGTYAYMAPEMINRELGPITIKADVWALGCLLLELYTGKVPWQGFETMEIMFQVGVKKNHPSIPVGLSRNLVDTLEMCFVSNPTQRASAMDVLEALKRVIFQTTEQQSTFSEVKCLKCSSCGNLANSTFSTTTLGDKFAKLASITSNEASSSVAKYSRFVPIEEDIILLPGMWPSDCNISVHDGSLYIVFHGGSKFEQAKLIMYTSQRGFEDYYIPSFKFELRQVVYSGWPIISSGNMLYLGGSARGESSPNATCILVWKKKRFVCALEISKQERAIHGCYTYYEVSPSGTLYCGCDDGTIEVWKPHLDPNETHVFLSRLEGHINAVYRLVVDENDTLYSCGYEKESTTVKVWRNCTQVAILNLGDLNMYDMRCTPEGKLYILSYGGSIIWCDLKYIAHCSVPSTTMDSQRRWRENITSGKSSASITNNSIILGLGIKGNVVIGSEVFSTLHKDGVMMHHLRSMPGSEIVILYGIKYKKISYIQAWRGNECIANLSTNIQYQIWTLGRWDVDKDGTMYLMDGNKICRWKLV